MVTMECGIHVNVALPSALHDGDSHRCKPRGSCRPSGELLHSLLDQVEFQLQFVPDVGWSPGYVPSSKYRL